MVSWQLQTAFLNPNSSAIFLSKFSELQWFTWVKKYCRMWFWNILQALTSTSPSNSLMKDTYWRWKKRRSEQEFHVQELKVTSHIQPLSNSSNYTHLRTIYSKDETEYSPRTSVRWTVAQLESTKELANSWDFCTLSSIFSTHSWN